MVANVQTMFYKGQTPWHGLGTPVENALTSADAIVKAGLDWNVKLQPMLVGYDIVPDYFAVQREDNQVILGVVGSNYVPFQNKEAFSFFDSLIGEKIAIYETAGALGKGEKVWILAKLPGYIRTKGDDVTEKYLLLASSHDGSLKVSVLFTPVRVVCQNTLSMALQTANRNETVRLKHTVTLGSRIQDVRDRIGLLINQFTLLETVSQKLANVSFPDSEIKGLVKASGLIPEPKLDVDSGIEKASTRVQNIIDAVSASFIAGPGADLESSKGTAWGALNAVIDYVDHQRGSDDQSTRANSILFGSGAIVKQKALNYVMELAK